MSPSTRRAWIEIQIDGDADNDLYWSPSTRRAWIEIRRIRRRGALAGSPSTRRAWIEIILHNSTLYMT